MTGLPPLVTQDDLCEGDKLLIQNLRAAVPDGVVVSQITAPDSDPDAPKTDVVWFDLQPNGITRVGANSGAESTYTEESLLATVLMAAQETAEVDATWSGDADDVVHIETSGPTLGNGNKSFPKAPESQRSSSPDGGGELGPVSPVEAMWRSRLEPSYKYVFQLNSPDSATAFEYRNLRTGDAGRISWDDYLAHLAGAVRLSRTESTLASVHDQLGLRDVEADLDEMALAYVDPEMMEYELETSVTHG